MTTDEQKIVAGAEELARELFVPPLGLLIAEAMGIVADVVRMAEAKPDVVDPLALMRLLRANLRAGVDAEWQAALNEGPR